MALGCIQGTPRTNCALARHPALVCAVRLCVAVLPDKPTRAVHPFCTAFGHHLGLADQLCRLHRTPLHLRFVRAPLGQLTRLLLTHGLGVALSRTGRVVIVAVGDVLVRRAGEELVRDRRRAATPSRCCRSHSIVDRNRVRARGLQAGS